jgi:hypothetical protein
MDKENNIIIITSALNEKRIFKKPCYCFKTKSQNKGLEKKIKKDKPTEILVYDITKSKKDKQNKIFNVNDHVNKTGENPLIKKNITPKFLDIQKTYKKQKKKKNQKTYKKSKKRQLKILIIRLHVTHLTKTEILVIFFETGGNLLCFCFLCLLLYLLLLFNIHNIFSIFINTIVNKN